MSGNLCCQGNVRENIIFEKSAKMMDHADCRTADNYGFLHLQILESRQICDFH